MTVVETIFEICVVARCRGIFLNTFVAISVGIFVGIFFVAVAVTIGVTVDEW